ncbi:helix-turn-helix domain-containing protein [Tenacibaculum sp. 190524A02b]|uniref:Helix-turn-helix domain-containing protein n=1 Tax=Tenacibaculum vairaonense TaxID=3137860 RepID=A0ABM9PN99_9FLAO
MNFTNLFLFFFGAIGVFNSLLISLYFLIFKNKQLPNLLFGFFLLFLTERAFRSLIYYYSSTLSNPYTQTDPLSFLFVGPFLFFYVLAVLNKAKKILRLWKPTVFIFLIIAILLGVYFPFLEDPIFWKTYILKAINLQWLCFILGALLVLFIEIKKEGVQKKKTGITKLWLVALLISVLILWNIYFFISYSYFIVGSIVFSMLFYTGFLFFIFRKKEKREIFFKQEKYKTSKIIAIESNEMLAKLQLLMTTEKLYKNSSLKLEDVALKLGVSKHQLSQVLNEYTGKNFTQYINAYRIEEAKVLIVENDKFTLEAIGKEAGFNSKTTFYNAFKKIEGVTPAVYKKQHKRSDL